MSRNVSIISLLPIFMVEPEVQLITELNKFFNFDHNIFVLDSSVDNNCFISRQEVIQQSVYVYKKFDDNITGLESLTYIRSKNTFMVVVAEGVDFHSNLHLLKRIKEIQGLQTKMKIGMFFPHLTFSDDLTAVFEWCKKELIVNVFAVTYVYPDDFQGLSTERLLNIFTFHPFGTFEFRNMTGAESYHSYFLSLRPNFQQYQLRLSGEYYGYSDKEFWHTVFRLMNASNVIVPLVRPDVQSRSTWYKNEIDIVPVLYTINRFSSNNTMYPLLMESQIIVVPEAEPYSDFSAYLLTITSKDFFVYSFVAITAVMLLLGVIRYTKKKKKKTLFFQSVADVLQLLMNDNANIQYQRLSRVEVYIIVPLTFMGLVIMNGILSNMKSYLTRPILQPQIQTIEEIYRSPFPIHTYGEKWKQLLVDALTNQTKHGDWIDKIIALDPKEQNHQMHIYNTSKSFLVNNRYFKQVLEVQKRLNIKGFYNPQIRMFPFHTAFVVLEKFLFFERLNEIVHRIQSAGLYDFWVRRHDSIIQKTIREENIGRIGNENESVVKDFEFPMSIVYGWLLSLIVLAIEIIWKNFKFSRLKFWRSLKEHYGQFFRNFAEKLRH